MITQEVADVSLPITICFGNQFKAKNPLWQHQRICAEIMRGRLHPLQDLVSR